MNTFIIFLRGINVSGQKLIKMAELKEKLEGMGLQSVRTYIQSGNVVVRREAPDPMQLEADVKAMIRSEYGWEVGVLVRRVEELAAMFAASPHLQNPEKDPKKVYFTMLGAEPEAEKVAELKLLDYSPEEWELIGQTVHFYSPNGYGRAKMNNNFFEKKLKVPATTRNVNTVKKMIAWGEEAAQKG